MDRRLRHASEQLLDISLRKQDEVAQNLAEAWATEKGGSCTIFGEIDSEAPNKRQNSNFFRDEYRAPVWSLPFYRFPRNLAGIRESVSV